MEKSPKIYQKSHTLAEHRLTTHVRKDSKDSKDTKISKLEKYDSLVKPDGARFIPNPFADLLEPRETEYNTVSIKIRL